VTCFRKGLAREFFETHLLPPPSTCYGFLLSLVGEVDRLRHVGCRVTPTLLGKPAVSTVLRTLWRIKTKTAPQGTANNVTPGHQQLLTHVELVLWLDSADETPQPNDLTLEQRVAMALDPEKRSHIDRFGGLSMGESTHLVNDVSLLNDRRREDLLKRFSAINDRRVFLCGERGRWNLPVWVDHVGAAHTRYAVGDLEYSDLNPPSREKLPRISTD
jgi:CRISPR-associated protein Cas5t